MQFKLSHRAKWLSHKLHIMKKIHQQQKEQKHKKNVITKNDHKYTKDNLHLITQIS